MKIDDDRREALRIKMAMLKWVSYQIIVFIFSLDFLQNSNYFHKSDINYLQLFIFSIF